MTNLEFKMQLERRTKEFAVAVFKYLDALPKKVSTRVVAYQLGKSASSIGANYREANRGESRDDFGHKLQIALKERQRHAIGWKSCPTSIRRMKRQGSFYPKV